MRLETVKIKSDTTENGFIVINKEDYDESTHEIFLTRKVKNKAEGGNEGTASSEGSDVVLTASMLETNFTKEMLFEKATADELVMNTTMSNTKVEIIEEMLQEYDRKAAEANAEAEEDGDE